MNKNDVTNKFFFTVNTDRIKRMVKIMRYNGISATKQELAEKFKTPKNPNVPGLVSIAAVRKFAKIFCEPIVITEFDYCADTFNIARFKQCFYCGNDETREQNIQFKTLMRYSFNYYDFEKFEKVVDNTVDLIIALCDIDCLNV